MNAREDILARVRAAVAGATASDPVPRDYRRSGAAGGAELVSLFAERVSDYRAEVRRVAPGGLAAAIATAVARTTTLVAPAGLPAEWLTGYAGIVQRDDPPIPVADLDEPGVSVLTGSAVAIAETGTIVLDTGSAQGRRALTLVPDHHVCVVRADQVVATVPEGLARLGDPTRPLTLISGPSATSDIELDRVEGVHGPRRLDVIVVQ